MIELGQTVTTPEGKIGRVAALNSGSPFQYMRYSGTELNIPVYAVILDNGKVERWTEAALTGNPEVRRSGSLK